MTKGILSDREQALEGSYFRHADAMLLDALRQNAKLDQIAIALREKLAVDDTELLIRVRDLGVSPETAPALFLAPLVQVACAGESVTKAARETVLRLARAREIDRDSPAYAQLKAWLQDGAPQTLFDTALEVLRIGFSVLPPKEREERCRGLIDGCHEVADASKCQIATLLGMSEDSTRPEKSLVAEIKQKLGMGTGRSAST